MTDDQLRGHIRQARIRAQQVGPQHAAWDLIFDGEAILAGKPSILTREQVEAAFLKAAEGHLE